jgi:ATP-dependent helicase STH1/SNF2
MDPMFEYEDKTTHFGSRKRRDTTDRQLNEIFEDIVDSCIKFDQTKIFHKPVKKKDYPDYYTIIEKPIDLYEIKNKTKRSEYKNREQFVSDFNLLLKNSEIYNGDTHEVTKQALKINEHALEKLDK